MQAYLLDELVRHASEPWHDELQGESRKGA